MMQGIRPPDAVLAFYPGELRCGQTDAGKTEVLTYEFCSIIIWLLT